MIVAHLISRITNVLAGGERRISDSASNMLHALLQHSLVSSRLASSRLHISRKLSISVTRPKQSDPRFRKRQTVSPRRPLLLRPLLPPLSPASKQVSPAQLGLLLGPELFLEPIAEAAPALLPAAGICIFPTAIHRVLPVAVIRVLPAEGVALG